MKFLLSSLIFTIVWVIIGVFIIQPYVDSKAAIMTIGGILGVLLQAIND
jgi:uncharacterized protein YhhL (DUF1145 family)